MNDKLYSNEELHNLRNRLNKEIKRRATFAWWDPLAKPKVGENTSSPNTIPDQEITVDDNTYTINTPSTDSLEETRNIRHPKQGDNPGGVDGFKSNSPNTSAARLDADELRNFLIGLAKIDDINLFYGRDEKPGFAFRNPQAIEDLLTKAEGDKLHEAVTFVWDIGLDDNGNLYVTYTGDEAPDVSINQDGDLLLSYNAGDRYECISTVKFHIDNGNLMVDDINDQWFAREDPNRGNKEYKEDERISAYEDLATMRFDIDNKSNLLFSKNYHFQYPFDFDAKLDEGDLVITCPSYLSPTFIIQDGDLYITYGDSKYYVTLDEENGIYVMFSGEYEGEEIYTKDGLGPNNFFDDYGAPKGVGNYHPYNTAISPTVRRNVNTQDDDRTVHKDIQTHGGIKSSTYGQNPRNPVKGDAYPGRPAYRGVPGSCAAQCTGLCYTTCDDECSESCRTTCFSRCGNACTATCGNACTGCSTLCYSSCKTKCENSTGYSCVKAGAKAVKITSSGGSHGEAGANNIVTETYSCSGCNYSCQYYPNKKTECWDSGCMGKCFNTCESGCSDSCTGGCIANDNENNGRYKVGKGKGCSAGCTMNCIGSCKGICEGQCIQTCYSGCKQSCTDNCEWICTTNCGTGCASSCKNGCTGCDTTCDGSCIADSTSKLCVGCSSAGGCTSTCQNDCSNSCFDNGCRSMCGTDSAGACDNNCRINCTGSSCTSLCEDQCSNQCTTCVNTCGWGCGACTGMCSISCEGDCEISCTENCENSCSSNCVQSCSEECGGCSNLCYSCVSMCIGVCALKCRNGCSSCDTMCGWWCDDTCSRQCSINCDDTCIFTCQNTCATFSTSNSIRTPGPSEDPTAKGYKTPHPSNRDEEHESFNLHLEEYNGKDK